MRTDPTPMQDAVKMYNEVSEDIREDIGLAHQWAIETLRDREGLGHQLFVIAGGDRQVVCTFAKPEWRGDHGGSPMDHAANAIVMSVCEYLSGC